MSREIWKFAIEAVSASTILIPAEAVILSVQEQHGLIRAWVLLNPEDSREPRRVLIVGTGHDIPPEAFRFINTFQMDGGNYVFHAFEGHRP